MKQGLIGFIRKGTHFNFKTTQKLTQNSQLSHGTRFKKHVFQDSEIIGVQFEKEVGNHCEEVYWYQI